MEAQSSEDQSSKLTSKVAQTYNQLPSVASSIGNFSSWLGVQKPISNLWAPAADHQPLASETPTATTSANRMGQLDDIANGICVQPVNRDPVEDQSIDNGRIPDWKQSMIDKNEAAKKEVAAILDDSLQRVIAKIEKKPYSQRDSGADSYTSTVDWIMWSVKGIVNRVK